MGDDEAFQRAIAAAPADDAPRLVYADWLDERGDPRAAYLRLVTQVARRVRDESPWDDLMGGHQAACEVTPVDWRERVGPWFDVVLVAVHEDQVISTIKAVRQWTRRGLAEAKELVDEFFRSGPVVVESGLCLDRAESLRQRLVADPWPGRAVPLHPVRHSRVSLRACA